MIDVIKYPDITKNISTPIKPPVKTFKSKKKKFYMVYNNA